MTLYARGGPNLAGQLGVGVGINSTIPNRSSPVQIGTGIMTPSKVGNDSWTQVSAGANHSLAIRTDGALFGWGSFAAKPFSKYTWKIAGGVDHAVGVRSDGALFTWGAPGSGQQGNFDLTYNRSSPSQIGSSSWSQVAAGTYASHAIRNDGRLFSWGINTYGQLGDNTINNKSSPVQIGTSSWIMVSSGNNVANSTTAAIRADGGLFAWGIGTAQIGQYTVNVSRSSPIQIGTSSWSQIATGTLMAAIRADGALFGWGGTYTGTGVVGLSSPVQITSLVHEVEQIGYAAYLGVTPNSWRTVSTNQSFSVGIQSDGSLWSWGTNIYGRLGLGFDTTFRMNQPFKVGNSSWTQVEAGSSHAIAIRADGTLWTWGDNTSGKLGVSDTINRSSPVQVYTPMYDIAAASSFDGTFMLKIRDDGILFGSGSNGFGELGINNTINRSSPVQIGTSSWSQVYAGGSYAMALRSDGVLFAWGDNTYGQLGLSDTIHRSSPVQLSTSSWTNISAGRNSVGLISPAGYLFMYGRNDSGQLGLMDTINRSSAVQVGSRNDWTKISAGELHSGGLAGGGKVFTWGSNQYGQIGVRDTINRSSPVQVNAGVSTVWYIYTDLSCGSNFTVASVFSRVGQVSSLYSWGRNNNYQLGDGSSINKSSPVQIPSSNVYGNLRAMNDYTIVQNTFTNDYNIRPSNNIFSWGLNNVGQLGLNDTNPRAGITTIGAGYLTSWTVVGASVAIPSKIPTVYGWGNNSTGRLGRNNTINVSSPTQLSTTINYQNPGSWSVIAAGQNNNFAIANNKLYAWGNNGAVGDMAAINRSEPVQIGTDSWTMVKTTYDTVLAKRPDNTVYIWGYTVNAAGANMGSYGTKSSPTQLTSMESNPDDMNGYATASSQTPYTWKYIAGGNNVTFGIRSDNKLFSTGYNVFGVLGTNPIYGIPAPGFKEILPNTQVPGASWVSVAAQADSAAGIQSDGSLWSWGSPQYGQLGYYTFNRSSPVQVRALYSSTDENTYASYLGYASPPQSISWSMVQTVHYSPVTNTTNYLSVAIDTTGGLWTWGTSNAAGELGRYDAPIVDANTAFLEPRKIGNESWTQVRFHTYLGAAALALKSDGTLWTWGGVWPFFSGEPESIYFRSSPVQIGTSSWTQIGYGGTQLLRADGALFVWGNNNFGQLGLGDTFFRSSPTQLGTSSWTAVAAWRAGGTTHAIRSDGRLFGWGRNTDGRLGVNDAVDKSSPVQIGTSSWSILSATGGPGAIRIDGRLFNWGGGGGGIGDNSTLQRNSPVSIGTSSWSFINAEGFGITVDGTLYAWGNNPSNLKIAGPPGTGTMSSPVQIGIVPAGMSFIFADSGSSSNYHIIEANTRKLYIWGAGILGRGIINTEGYNDDLCVISELNESWTQVSGMAYSLAAIRNDGRLFTWGYNNVGQVGRNNANNTSFPYKWGTESWTQASAGHQNIFGIRANGTLWGAGWGPGLGINETINRSSPVQIGTGSWSQISSGLSHALALDTSNNLYVWGDNAGAQLGLNNTIGPRSSPVQLGSSTYSEIVAGWSYSQAIRSDGKLFAWGINTSGKLGNNDTTQATMSSPVQIGTSTWTSVAAGITHAAGLTSDGSLYTWGNFALGAGGTERLRDPYSPTFVSTVTDYFTDIGPAFSHTTAIRSDGALFTWGRNSEGQLGDGTVIERSLPVKIGSESWTNLGQLKGYSTFVKRIDGTTWATGSSGSGQLLGDFTRTNRSSPTQLGAGTESWIIASSDGNTLGLTYSGALYAWGANTSGQNGIPLRESISSPVFVPTISDSFSMVSTAVSHAAAIRSDGRLFLWGYNGQGQLGTRNTIESRTLNKLDTRSWTQVITGSNYTQAIRSDGLLFAWGDARNGQVGTLALGLVNSLYVSSPVQLGAQSYSMISSGDAFNFATRTDGVIFSLGYGVNGELGINFGTRRSSPVQLGTIGSYIVNPQIVTSPTQIGTSSWSQVSAGNDFSMAIRSDNVLFEWGANPVIPIVTSPTQVGYPMPSPTLVGYSGTQVIAGVGNFGFLKSV